MAETLGTVASIIAVLGLAKSAVSLLRDIKDASAQCKSLITEISFTRGILESLKDTISDFDAARTWTQTIELLAQPNGPISCLEKVLQALNEKLAKPVKTTKSKKIMQSMLWPFSKGESEDILRSIERQKVSLLLALENNHLRLAMAIQEDTKQNGQTLQSMHEDVKEVIDGISKIGLSFEDHLSSDILSWISPVNASTAQDQIYNSLAPGTGEWILATPKFETWVAGNSKTLFCPGIPGAGKSCLASQIIRYLETRANLIQGARIVAWIYCDYRDSSTHSVLLFIASLLKQILQNTGPLPSSVKDLYHSHGKGSSSVTLVEARELLRNIVAVQERCFVVVDALDECTDEVREQLVNELVSLKPSISLLVTSRPILSIENMFRKANIIPIVPNKNDVEIYIDRRLETETKLHKIVKTDLLLQQEIRSTLVAKNQGIFLMTKLHLDALVKRAKHSKKALRDALADLPLDLDKTYEDAMTRIAAQDEEDASLAMKVLSWMLTSFRRMTVRELQEALAVQSDYDENDEESLIDPEFFISVCGGLLVLDRGRYVEWISFVHLTTGEFFERNAMTCFPTAGFDISSVCVKQLTTRHISLDDLTQSPETAMNEFTEYAARYAMMHVQSSREPGLLPALEALWQSGQLKSVRKAFNYLTDDGASLTNLEEKSLIHPYSEFTELQLAVLYGCDTDVEAIIAEGFHEDGTSLPTFDESEILQIPAVCIAIHEHNFHVLDLLLKAEAKLDIIMFTRYGPRLTAVECAIAREDQDMVKFLLSRSPALTSYRPMSGRNALQFAVTCYLPELVSYLIGKDAGIGVDETDDDGRTALHYLARCLNYRDIDMNMKYRGKASEESHCNTLPTFKVLQQASANINAHDNFGNTPLDYVIARSVSYRSNKLYTVLVELGAHTGWDNRLQAALRYGTQKDAQQLLDKNANIYPLPDSSRHGMVRLLLSRERFHISNRELFHNPHLEQFIVQECSLAGALLDWEGGIHSETVGESDFLWMIKKISCLESGSMLGMTEHKVARQTHLHVLGRLLLTQRITEINIVVDGNTPLLLATVVGSAEIVELLLSHGADNSFTGPGGLLPVQLAARSCFPRVVEVLLKKKPSILPYLAAEVHEKAISDCLWFQDPLTFPRDRHETVWLLCAYLGRKFPRTKVFKKIRQRKLARRLLNGPSQPATLLNSASAIRIFLDMPYKTSDGMTSWKSVEINP